MKLIRRLVFVIALMGALACIVLLLNFTAPNPTGRRYSSAPVQISGGSQAIGASGELILSRDLHTPNNNDADQLQCICNGVNKPPLSQCNRCFVTDPSVGNYRIPDFVSAKFIAEAKNRQDLLFSYSDQVSQISDYVSAAKISGRPLWLYTRVDTALSPEFYSLVASTGGGVVAYFTTPGYVDSVDLAARDGIAVTVIVMGAAGIWELGAALFVSVAQQPRTPTSPKAPKDPLDHVERKTDHAEDFAKSARERTQRKMDIEDAFDDDLQ